MQVNTLLTAYGKVSPMYLSRMVATLTSSVSDKTYSLLMVNVCLISVRTCSFLGLSRSISRQSICRLRSLHTSSLPSAHISESGGYRLIQDLGLPLLRGISASSVDGRFRKDADLTLWTRSTIFFSQEPCTEVLHAITHNHRYIAEKLKCIVLNMCHYEQQKWTRACVTLNLKQSNQCVADKF